MPTISSKLKLCDTVDDSLIVEIHGPNSIPSIGEQVTLNCTTLGLTESPVLTLKHPNGTNLSSVSEVSILFDPVRIADAGEYVCTGEIKVGNITTVIVEAKQNLILKCKHI